MQKGHYFEQGLDVQQSTCFILMGEFIFSEPNHVFVKSILRVELEPKSKTKKS